MGFFKNLKKAAAGPEPAPKRIETCCKALEPWKLDRQPTGTVLITGDYEKDIYTYDARPLNGVSGAFRLQVIPANCTLESIYTGFVCETGDTDVAVAYNHYIVGVLKWKRKFVMQALAKGLVPEFDAHIDGFVKGYNMVPRIVVHVPSEYVSKWLQP